MELVETGRIRSCRCGHVADAHAHYRPGTDCAQCGCAHFRRVWLARRRRRAPVPIATVLPAHPPLKIVS